MIGREGILKLIPHAGRMCLIDRVSSWNPQEIHCEADSHRDPENPLCRTGGLSAVHVIEYGAQAAAIHASLAKDPAPAGKAGFLVSVRGCELQIDRLDVLPRPLQICARREAASAAALAYSFEVSYQDRVLGGGRLMIGLAQAQQRAETAQPE